MINAEILMAESNTEDLEMLKAIEEDQYDLMEAQSIKLLSKTTRYMQIASLDWNYGMIEELDFTEWNY